MEPSHIDAVLAARADKLASRRKAQASNEEKTLVSLITVGAECFGIPTRHLSCIIKAPPVAAMPNLPPWLKGVCQIRGELVGVVDISSWFGLNRPSKGDYMAVMEEGSRKLGLLLDAVGGFRDIGVSDIAETFGNVSMDEHPIWATTKDVITILDIPKLFTNRDMVVDPMGSRGAVG